MIYDISVPIHPSMVCWPGDPKFEISTKSSIWKDGCQTSLFQMGTHTGTHIDAPRHLIEGGRSVDQIPLNLLVGKAYVFEINPMEDWAIQPDDLSDAGIPHGATRVLFKTTNSDLWSPGPQSFEQHFVHLSKRAARWLVGRNVKLVGIDYMSVDAFSAGLAAHEQLLKSGVVIVENLDLSRVNPGVYELAVLPLKLIDADGAPARAILIR